jgi:hypothetical protein
MNLRLSDRRLKEVCSQLLAEDPALSGRQLRAALRTRFGVACRTERVYATWRSIREGQERAAADRSTDQAELVRQLELARLRIGQLETALIDAEQRALRAEERERVHQDRWAGEIDTLRRQMQRNR